MDFETTETGVCLKHSGHTAKINELCKFKEKMTESETGTIDRIWTALDKLSTHKIGKGLAITLTVALIGMIGTLFALIYQTNSTVLLEIGEIKADVAGIVEKLK